LIEECGGNKKPAEAGDGYFSFSGIATLLPSAAACLVRVFQY
jgi:hypothetical protein